MWTKPEKKGKEKKQMDGKKPTERNETEKHCRNTNTDKIVREGGGIRGHKQNREGQRENRKRKDEADTDDRNQEK